MIWKISPKVIVLLVSIFALPAHAKEWRGLHVSGIVIRGGYDTRGQPSDYSLLVRFENRGDHSIRIKMHELYNATLNVYLVDSRTGKELLNKPGRTGDVIPKQNPDNMESIEIGPKAFINVAIGLDGFERFHQGKFKGKHLLFKLEIPEFEITKNGDVLNGVPK